MHALIDPASPSAPPTAAATRSFPRSLDHEQELAPLRVEGRLPADLRGTFYRNGPARFATGTHPHWFDGDGAVSAVRLDGQTARGGVKLLHTPSIDGDKARSTPRYGGFRQPISYAQRVKALFGAPAVRNVANINLLPWQGRLFALHETTLPVEIDPATLATIGETNLDGLIRQGWNAHPRRVASRHTIYQFGLRIGPTVHLDVYALPATGTPHLLTSLPLPGVMEVHDFFVTDNYLVFVLPPLWCSSLELLRRGSFVEALTWRPTEPTTIVIVPIDHPHAVQRIETEPFFFWHSVNAFERAGGGELVLDLIRYPDFASTKDHLDARSDGRASGEPGGTLWRGLIDLRARTVSWEERWAHSCEFASVHRAVQGRAHRQTWLATTAGQGAGSGWYDSLSVVEVESGRARSIAPGSGCEVSEPALVARSEREDDVYVLALIGDHRANASWLGIWDGNHAETEPLARVWFDQLLPAPLHGCWVGEHS